MAIRFYAPHAEAEDNWLAGILETFYLFDLHVEVHLKKISKNGVTPVCRSGCHACCLEPAVPITEPEIKAISWYASKILSGYLRAQVKKQLIEHSSRLKCPFLVNCTCSIYVVRPLACRKLFISSKRCKKGENVHKTRPLDIVRLPEKTIIQPMTERLHNSFKFIPTENTFSIEPEIIEEHVEDMRLYDWTQIANNMEGK